jgi:hypothetical protein
VYSLIPIFLVFREDKQHISWNLGCMTAILLGTFFVNSASLFMLSSMLEKRQTRGEREITTVTMPPALIEGFESYLFFTIMIIVPENFLFHIYTIFSIMVSINIIQRLIFARKVIN